ncbi:MAG: class I SAM-dependent methyltransferase [Achromobacter sp.]|nr:class I SAM-dependent methyltransferase [Achromobacter sp.]
MAARRHRHHPPVLAGAVQHHRFVAAAALARLDYDFARFRLGRSSYVGIALRAWKLDRWAAEFLAAHPDACVAHLGCGLDSRVFRVDPPPEVNWFDVDFPEVIDLRRALYPARPGYRMLGSPMSDLAWLSRIPTDRPALVVAEGLFLYMPEDEVLQLMRTVATQFPSGEIAFDAYSRMGLALASRNRMFRATGAVMRWSLGDPLDLEAQVPGLRLRNEQGVYEEGGHEEGDGRQWARYSWPARAAIWLMRRVAPLRRLGRLLRYRY